MPNDSTTQLQQWLDLIRRGDDTARASLIQYSCERLRRLTRKMLRRYPRLRRWEQTDDVFQNALVRLYRSLAEVKPDSVPQFFSLAATQIRRSLLDLIRHHFGAEGEAAHHDTGHVEEGQLEIVARAADTSLEPKTLEQWGTFHEQVERLPDKEREIFNLLWYEGLSQREAASVLGVDVRTVKRHWQSARILIRDALEGKRPE